MHTYLHDIAEIRQEWWDVSNMPIETHLDIFIEVVAIHLDYESENKIRCETDC